MVPDDRYYSKEHEWFRFDDGGCVMGITDFAQDELGEVVFVELPEVGDRFEAGDEIGTIESVKAVSELYTAVGGEIVEVNGALADRPEVVNQDPHGEGWLVKIRPDGDDREGLMSAAEYEAFTRGD